MEEDGQETNWMGVSGAVSDATMMCVFLWMWMVVILLSRHGVKRKTVLAGWGFTVMKSYQGRDEAPMVEACGLVDCSRNEQHSRDGGSD